jgi:electron transport complex protein RnfB
MSAKDDTFNELSAVVGAPGSKYFPRVLEAMMTLEEAQILLELKKPTTAEDLAAKFNVDPKSLQAKLDGMEQRMIIRKVKDAYVTPNNVVAFHHGSVGWMPEEMKARAYPLWGEFFYAEWRDIIVDGFEKRHRKGVPGAHRIVPAHKALKASNIPPDQILWYEDMEQILKRSVRFSLMMCGCRGLWRKCDNPVDVCLKIEFPTPGGTRPVEQERLLKPPRDVSYEEALAVINDCEDRGLVHIPLNTSHADLYCNCCDDCCMVINPLLHRGNVHEILTPSRFRATVNEDLCSGCQTCVERCKFDAIEMRQVPGSKKLKSSVIKEHCLGCGACVVSCKQKALTLELVRPPSHIPTVSAMELFMMERR